MPKLSRGMHQRKCVRKGQKEQKYTFLLNEKMQGLQVMKVCLQGPNGTKV